MTNAFGGELHLCACENQMNFLLLARILLVISRRVCDWEAGVCTQHVLALRCLVIWRGVWLGGHALIIKPGLSSPLVTFYHALRSETKELGGIKGFGDWDLKDFQPTVWHSRKNRLTGQTQGKPVWCLFSSLPLYLSLSLSQKKTSFKTIVSKGTWNFSNQIVASSQVWSKLAREAPGLNADNDLPGDIGLEVRRGQMSRSYHHSMTNTNTESTAAFDCHLIVLGCCGS